MVSRLLLPPAMRYASDHETEDEIWSGAMLGSAFSISLMIHV